MKNFVYLGVFVCSTKRSWSSWPREPYTPICNSHPYFIYSILRCFLRQPQCKGSLTRKSSSFNHSNGPGNPSTFRGWWAWA